MASQTAGSEEEAIEAHNNMVFYLHQNLTSNEINDLKNLFRHCPLTPRDIANIHDMVDLFAHLQNVAVVSVGNYEYFTRKLKLINPRVAQYVDETEKKIKGILNKEAKDMYEFLKIKGIPEDILKRMKAEKITMETVAKMSPDHGELAKYLCLGDRIDLLEFCKINSKKEIEKPVKNTRNENATRTQIVELVWIHNDVKVQGCLGGGTRKLTVTKTCTKADLLEEAKKIYFPDGISSRNVKAEDCTFCLRDFTQKPLKDGMTVGKFSDSVKITGRLRFHMHSTGPPMLDSNKHEQVTHRSAAATTYKPKKTLSVRKRKHADPPTTVASSTDRIGEPVSQPEIRSEQQHTNTPMPPDPLSANPVLPGPQPSTAIQPEPQSTNTIQPEPQSTNTIQHEPQSTNTILPESQPTNPSGSQIPQILTGRNIRIRRTMLQNDMIANFKDLAIIEQTVTFTFVDERGIDVQGVSRDAYTCFWENFIGSSTKGEQERIPTIMPKFQKEDWAAIGRILVKGFCDQGVFPIQISRAFFIAMLYGEQVVSQELLVDSFKRYVTDQERIVVEKALEGVLEEDDDKEDFYDLLGRMDCSAVPSANTKDVIMQIAHTELIQQGKYALDVIASVAKNRLLANLPTLESLLRLYKDKEPERRKVIKLLNVEPSNTQENTILNYLKQLIRGFTPDLLAKFLHFVTGARVICVDDIKITFNETVGLARVPIARTCGPVLELPVSYSSFTEFRQEFLNVLSSHSSQRFDID